MQDGAAPCTATDDGNGAGPKEAGEVTCHRFVSELLQMWEPPAGIFDNQRGKVLLTRIGEGGVAVQAGTPMSVTKEADMCIGDDAMSVSLLWFENIPAGGM